MPTCAPSKRASAKSPPRTARRGTSPAPNRMGLGIRVLAHGCWGFAATDDLTGDGMEAAAALALEIARVGHGRQKARCRAGARREVRSHLGFAHPHRSVLHSGGPQSGDAAGGGRGAAPQSAASAWRRPRCTSSGERQVFASTLGSLIDQTRYQSGAGFSALCYKDGEIQKRSYPNSFGGQYQLKGYELVDELDLLENAPRIAEEAVALHSADQCPEGRIRPDSGQLATGPADSRIDRPPHRAGPRAGQRSQLRRHELPDARPACIICATARRS